MSKLRKPPLLIFCILDIPPHVIDYQQAEVTQAFNRLARREWVFVAFILNIFWGTLIYQY